MRLLVASSCATALLVGGGCLLLATPGEPTTCERDPSAPECNDLVGRPIPLDAGALDDGGPASDGGASKDGGPDDAGDTGNADGGCVLVPCYVDDDGDGLTSGAATCCDGALGPGFLPSPSAEPDNCPTVATSDTHDEDGDEKGDPCDVCPGTPDPTQANADALTWGVDPNDDVGDACDPSADDLHVRVAFDGFATLDDERWLADPGVSAGDDVVLFDSVEELTWLVHAPFPGFDVAAQASGRFVGGASGDSSFSIVGRTVNKAGIGCLLRPSGTVGAFIYFVGGGLDQRSSGFVDGPPVDGPFTLTLELDGGTVRCAVTYETNSGLELLTAEGPDYIPTPGTVALRVNDVDVELAWVDIVERVTLID